MSTILETSFLSKIWVLSDTTKSGQLLFPEFALAMYLCNIRLTGRLVLYEWRIEVGDVCSLLDRRRLCIGNIK
jgi:hypothetical protein